MGVQGLWDLLSPIGRPVSLESLENKILAVDVSIWLNQAVKGIRDRKGESVPNAHLLSIFNKICKLLFYKIKPVFVFDGSVPLLKRQTMLARQTQRDAAAKNVKKASYSILRNYLIRNMKSKKSLSEAGIERQDQLCSQIKKNVTSDIYSASNDMYYMSSNARDDTEPYTQSESDEEMDVYDDYMLKNFQNPSLIDFETEEFKSLPLEVQHELLNTIRETHKRRFWFHQEMPEEYQTFSSYQMNRLLQRRRIQKRLEEVEKDISSKNTASLETIYKSYMNIDVENSCVEASRVMSEDSSHFILVKQQSKNSDKNQMEEHREVDLICQNETVEVEMEKLKNHSISFSTIETVVLDESVPKNSSNSVSQDKPTITEVVLQEVNTVSDGCSQEVTLNSSDHITLNTSLPSHSLHDSKIVYTSQPSLASSISSATAEIPEQKHGFCCNNKIALNETKDTGCVRHESKEREYAKQDTKAFDRVANICHEEVMQERNIEQIIGKKNEVPPFVSVTVTLKQSDEDEDELVPVEEFETTEENMSIEDLETTEENVNVEKLKRTEDCENVEGDKEVDYSYLLESQDSISLTEELEALNREKQRHERRTQTIAEHMYEETKELLKLFGVPFIDSPTEAEAQCAKLDILNLTNGTITDDSDIWLFGGKCVYKNFFSKNKYVEFFKHTDIESHFKLDRPKLIALAMLTGSDYTQGIQGIGPVTAMEILSEFPGEGIENLQNFKKWWSDFKMQKELPKNAVCEKLGKFHLDDGFPSEVVYDAYLHPTVDESTERFSWGYPDLDQLREFAGEKFGWDKKKIDDMLLPVLKKLNENQLQTRIDSFFSMQLRKVENPFSSKRVKKAITKMHSQEVVAKKNSRSGNKVQRKSRTRRKQNKKLATSSPKQPTEINLSEESSSDS